MAKKSKKERAAAKGKKKSGLTIGDLSKVQSSFHVGAGPQRVKISEAEVGEGDKGDYIKWGFEVTKGKYKGRKPKPFYTSLAEDSLWNLKRLLEAAGFEIPDGKFDLDPSDLIGEELDVIIDHEVYNGRRQSIVVDFGDEETAEDEDDEAEEEDEDEKPAKGKKAKAGKKKKDEEEDEEEEDDEAEEEEDEEPSEEALMAMTEEELEDFCTDNELEVDLDDFRVISKKRKAVVKAAKKAKLI